MAKPNRTQTERGERPRALPAHTALLFAAAAARAREAQRVPRLSLAEWQCMPDDEAAVLRAHSHAHNIIITNEKF